MALFLDASALVKLVFAEPETAALTALWNSHEGDLVTCELARTELLRAAGRVEPPRRDDARKVLDVLAILPLTEAVTGAAGLLDPPSMRSLDAIYLAAALELGDDLDAVVTYDRRQADAARRLGLPVLAPA